MKLQDELFVDKEVDVEVVARNSCGKIGIKVVVVPGMHITGSLRFMV